MISEYDDKKWLQVGDRNVLQYELLWLRWFHLARSKQCQVIEIIKKSVDGETRGEDGGAESVHTKRMAFIEYVKQVCVRVFVSLFGSVHKTYEWFILTFDLFVRPLRMSYILNETLYATTTESSLCLALSYPHFFFRCYFFVILLRWNEINTTEATWITNIRQNKVSLFFHLFAIVEKRETVRKRERGRERQRDRVRAAVWWCFCDKKF